MHAPQNATGIAAAIKGSPLGAWISVIVAIFTAIGWIYGHFSEIDHTSREQIEMRQDIKDVQHSLTGLSEKVGEVNGKIDAILSRKDGKK